MAGALALHIRAAVPALVVGVLCSCVAPASQSEEFLTVFAASSLSETFPLIDPEAFYQFAGSDELALQIREGATPDIFAGASPVYAASLFEQGLVEKPRVFATNILILIVPRDNPAEIRSLADLETREVRLVIGAPGLPAGDYARELLANARAEEVLDSVVSEEESVTGIVGKVALGEADAGFVYATDAAAAGERVAAIALPRAIQPDIRYTLAIVVDTPQRQAAVRFIDSVIGPTGRSILRNAGFRAP